MTTEPGKASQRTAGEIRAALRHAGAILRQTRKARGLSTGTVAAMLGRQSRWLLKVERGEIVPPLPVLLALIDCLGLTLADLFPADPTDPVVQFAQLLRTHPPRVATTLLALWLDVHPTNLYGTCIPATRAPETAASA